MDITFEKDYLREIYTTGQTNDKRHRFQPEIIRKYIRVIDFMIDQPDITALSKYNSLHYEKLKGDKAGFSSVRVNDKYRIEFEEKRIEDQAIVTICNITELSNHYK
ncbi:MAG: type II toxin-antitoxin system RelE/ParE family toxin [Tannerellaceae bacterium]|jgi:proteic killer suppression protein|nr:type II toxin-antitoxin system RelE/ParE family toxin [Tannerellaceae bacterium]